MQMLDVGYTEISSSSAQLFNFCVQLKPVVDRFIKQS